VRDRGLAHLEEGGTWPSPAAASPHAAAPAHCALRARYTANHGQGCWPQNGREQQGGTATHHHLHCLAHLPPRASCCTRTCHSCYSAPPALLAAASFLTRCCGYRVCYLVIWRAAWANMHVTTAMVAVVEGGDPPPIASRLRALRTCHFTPRTPRSPLACRLRACAFSLPLYLTTANRATPFYPLSYMQQPVTWP